MAGIDEALAGDDDIDRALAAYNAVRRALSERIVTRERKLGTQLGVDLATDEGCSMWRLLQRHRAMLD